MDIKAIKELRDYAKNATIGYAATLGRHDLGELIVEACDQLLALIRDREILTGRITKLEAEARQLRDCGVC